MVGRQSEWDAHNCTPHKTGQEIPKDLIGYIFFSNSHSLRTYSAHNVNNSMTFGSVLFYHLWRERKTKHCILGKKQKEHACIH